jgi:putative flavoprotein involved in K+ transport
MQTEGLSPVAGLYFVGRPWQRNRASALIMGAGEDAATIVERMAVESPPA